MASVPKASGKEAATDKAKKAPAKRVSWTKDQVVTLRDMWLRGASDAELEEALDRSANAIAIKAHRLGLPPRAEAVIQMQGGEAVKHAPGADEEDWEYERPKPIGKIRSCLMCQSEFWSSHAGERICPDCKSTDFWRNGSWMSEGGGGWDDW
ncbi:MAG: hypothetical protein Alpg2KO_24830 [Alphaproteobacteria bacterium]